MKIIAKRLKMSYSTLKSVYMNSNVDADLAFQRKKAKDRFHKIHQRAR